MTFVGAAACDAKTIGSATTVGDVSLDSGISSGAQDSGPVSSEAGFSDACVGPCSSLDAAPPVDATTPSNDHLDAATEAEAGSSDIDVGADASPAETSTDSTADAGCASGSDPTWASWPMPNAGSDLDAGAPNPQSYTDNGDGTVTDNVTGLMWQQAIAIAGVLSGSPGNDPAGASAEMANAAVWTSAAASCQSLTLAGHDDWRLPTLIELVSIDDFGVDPPLDGAFSEPAADASTWDPLFMSGTPAAGVPNVWWIIHSVGGGVGWGSASPNQDLVFRCVRAPHANPSTCRYAYPAAGTVLDTKTQLTWQQTGSDASLTESDGAAYCSTLNLAGGGWRLPTTRELLTIVDYSTGMPFLDPTAFPTSLPRPEWQNVYWSSTSAGILNQGSDLGVRFDLGGTESTPDDNNGVRCVR